MTNDRLMKKGWLEIHCLPVGSSDYSSPTEGARGSPRCDECDEEVPFMSEGFVPTTAEVPEEIRLIAARINNWGRWGAADEIGRVVRV